MGFAFYSPHEAIVRLFGVNESPEVAPHYNIAPTQFVAAVRAEQDQSRRLSMLCWGSFVLGRREIDRRAHDQRARRDAERQARVSQRVPDSPLSRTRRRYYEWQRSQSVKQPRFRHICERRTVRHGGLLETWRDPANGERLESCTIVTTTPAASVAHLHDRMPVIVPSAAHAEWLDPGNRTPRGWLGCSRRFRRTLASHAVGRRVNSARNDEPDLVLAASGE
jgi:putative SOS response-associated peptidase YedK